MLKSHISVSSVIGCDCEIIALVALHHFPWPDYCHDISTTVSLVPDTLLMSDFSRFSRYGKWSPTQCSAAQVQSITITKYNDISFSARKYHLWKILVAYPINIILYTILTKATNSTKTNTILLTFYNLTSEILLF